MSALTDLETVIYLKNQYAAPQLFFEKKKLSVGVKSPSSLIGFIGSLEVVFLTSQNCIKFGPNTCIAAPKVNMVATHRIELGIAGHESEGPPPKLHVFEQLSITTDHLLIGNLTILSEPKWLGDIQCKKLTLSKSTDDDPEYFEILKSWCTNDSVDISIIQK